MKIEEAIIARHSVRAYRLQPLAEDVARALEEKIKALNDEGELHMQLILNEPEAFRGKLAKYGRFRNVTNYIVMAGKKADGLDERIGYYGEQLVLLAQTLGLNSCWVGLSYKKIPGTYILDEGETIKAYIAIGYGQTQGEKHKIKVPAQVSNIDEGTPDWFAKGVEAALLAPTAVNQQKFFFEYIAAKEGEKACVKAKTKFSLIGFTEMDLGIVKYHFEIGAGQANFNWAK